MSIEFFIAKRIGSATHKSFSRAILRLAVVSIALSMVVMIIATSIVAGFKNTISEKIFGFWGHIHVTSSHSPSSYAFESSPMNLHQDYYPAIDTIGQIHYLAEETDWIASLGPNLYSVNWLIAGLFLLLTFLMLRLPIKVKAKFHPIPRLGLALVFFITALVFMAIHPYVLVPKDVEKTTQGGVRHIQMYANKEGIIKTKTQIEGVILRGVGLDYDWEFLQQYMIEGVTLAEQQEGEEENGILISQTTAKRLELKLGDSFLIYFVQGGNSSARKFNVIGIYKTGLEEYDRRFAIVDISVLQQLNNWRPYRNYGTELHLDDERVVLHGLTAQTGNDWSMIRNHLSEGEVFDLTDTSSLQAMIPQRVAYVNQLQPGDTLALRYKDLGGDVYIFNFEVAGIYNPPAEALDRTVFVHWNAMNRLNYLLAPQVSGFEIFVENLDDLDAYGDYTNYVALMGKQQYANTIKELEPNIFDWLNLTDTNERVILLFMILVSIINMTTSLMILILERTNMIGVLKALGAQNWSIRKIFLFNATYIIGYGLFWGNLLGVGLCLLQMQFGIITLPEDLYYVSVAPVELNWMTLLMLNLGTLLITVIVLIIPSWLVTRIDPVKAIRFS